MPACRVLVVWLAIAVHGGALQGQELVRLPPTGDQPQALPAVGQDAADVPGEEPTCDDSSAAPDVESPQPSFAELMRPTIGASAEWFAEASDIELAWYRADVQVPTYPIFGPPPPMVNGGFAYGSVLAPESLDLPEELFDYSLGLSWLRLLGERWVLRSTASAALATDGNNTGSEAWQFRGGVFTIYRPDDVWTWIFGAVATGRNDLPVVPAVGAIWQPQQQVRFDLTFPRPRANWRLMENGARQQWAYFGAGLEGGTWAYERSSSVDDQLTYRDWRIVLGWETVPTPNPRVPFSRGRKVAAEVGYAFDREFEFERGAPSIDIAETLLFRVCIGF